MPKQRNDDATEFPFSELAEKGFSVPEMNAVVAFERYEDGYRETGNVLFAFLAFYEAYRPRGRLGHGDPIAENVVPPAVAQQPVQLPDWAASALLAGAVNMMHLASGRDPAKRPPAADTEEYWAWERKHSQILPGPSDILRALGFSKGSGNSVFKRVHDWWRDENARDAYQMAERFGGDPLFAARCSYQGISRGAGKEKPERVTVDPDLVRKAIRRARDRARARAAMRNEKALSRSVTRPAAGS